MPLFKNQKTTKAWFMSYLIILAFAITANIIAYTCIEKSIVEQNNHYVSELLERRKITADNIKRSVANIATEIANNDSVSKLASMKEERIADGYADIMDAYHAIAPYRSVEGGFGDIYVYFHNLDYCVGINTSNTANIYYDAQVRERLVPRAEWFAVLRSFSPGTFITVPAADGGENPTVFYVLSVNGTERFKSAANVIVEMDDFFDELSGGNYGDTFYILDNDGNVIMPDSADKKKAIQKFFEKNDFANGITYGGSRVSIMTDSADGDWKYLYLVNKAVFRKSISRARAYIIIFNLFGLAAATFISLLFTRKNYKPVQSILDIFGKSDGAYESEFGYIRDKIETMVSENKKYGKMQDEFVKSAFLSRLLSDRFPIGNKDEIMDFLDIRFPYSAFAAVLCYIDVNDEMFFDDQNDDERESYELAKLVVTNVTGDMLGDEFVLQSCEVGDMLALVINCDNTDADGIVRRIEDMSEFVLRNFNIHITAGVSNLHFSLDELADCCDEATMCIELYFAGSGSVIQYSRINKSDDSWHGILPMAQQQLSESITVGSRDMFRNALDKIFVDTIGGAKSVGEVRFAMYSVVNTVMRALSERSEFCDEVNISDILRRIDSISVNTDMDELRDAVEEAFGIVFAESGNSLHTERGDDAAERAKKYIDEQYADPNLTATLIADECGISAAYLSTCFKKKYSTGLLEYINGVRIDHAKRILENDDYTVEQVITMVGYSNRRSFYRMFSRYVGITPNKYRAYVMADKKIT